AAAVRPGMVMLTASGAFVPVSKVESADEVARLYDLDIENTHNFIAQGVVTHNSVYSWRGARVENMMRLATDFPGCETVRLEQNYRSTGTILNAANGLIARNTARLGKELWTDTGDGEPVQLYAAYNEYDEAEFVVN